MNKLNPQEKKAVFLKMCSAKDAPARMMAVQGLKPFASDPQVKKTLQGLTSDKDEDVAALAKDVLGGGK